MTIEKLGDMQIAYMRRTGGYGEGNRQLMEQFKRYLREHALLQEDTTILGIALDTEEGVSDFWRDLPQRAARLPVDGTRPILERYAHPKVSAHICEFCVPLRESKLRGI